MCVCFSAQARRNTPRVQETTDASTKDKTEGNDLDFKQIETIATNSTSEQKKTDTDTKGS